MIEALEIVFAPALIELLSLRKKQKGGPLTEYMLNAKDSFFSS
jgi:hypothetical protein